MLVNLAQAQPPGKVGDGTAGDQHFEKPIPAGWITAGQDITVGAEVDKVAVDPQEGLKLGIVLVRIGITQ